MGKSRTEELSSIFNVPHLRNPNFVGRDILLTRLRDAIESDQASPVIQAIHGLGGVGKTQIAIEYAYLFGKNYDIVWWIRSEESLSLASDYAKLAEALGLTHWDAQDQRVIIKMVREWLSQHSKWLLVFDNASTVEEVQDYIPRIRLGHVIITTRNPNWKSIGSVVPVGPLLPPEAVEFITKRTGQKDLMAAKEIVEQLGCLPLALEQAGAYIEASGCSLAQYLALYRTHQQELLKRGKPTAAYGHTVATTWSLSFKAIESESITAAKVLRLCSFYSPDEIPTQLFGEWVTDLPSSLSDLADGLGFNDALSVLRKYSMVEK